MIGLNKGGAMGVETLNPIDAQVAWLCLQPRPLDTSTRERVDQRRGVETSCGGFCSK